MPLLVPCGTCSYCRNSRSTQLALLCDKEASASHYCAMVNLDYDNNHLPIMRFGLPTTHIGRADEVFSEPVEISLTSMRDNRPARSTRVGKIVSMATLPIGKTFFEYTDKYYYISQPKDKYYYTEYQASLRAQAVLNAMEADKVRILNKYLPGQMMAQTFTLMAQGKLFEAQAITEGVESQLKGEELNLFRRTVNSVATALNVQNWFNVGYYGGPQAYHQGQQQRSQEWTARDLGNKTNRINLDFLNDTYKWRVNTVKWQNKNEKMNFARNVIGSVGDVVKIGTMLAPGSRLGNVFFKPSAPTPAPQGSISFF